MIFKSKTGVGDRLVSCEARFKNIDWNKCQSGLSGWNFTFVTLMNTKDDPKELTKYYKDKAEGYCDSVLDPFEKALHKLRKRAVKTGGKFKKSKKIPKSSTKYVMSIAYKAEDMIEDLPKLKKKYLATFDQEFQNYKKIAHMEEKIMKTAYKNMKKGLGALKKKPDADTFQEEFRQPLRAFVAQIAKSKLAAVKEFSDEFAEYTSDGYKNKLGKPKKLLKKVDKILKRSAEVMKLYP